MFSSCLISDENTEKIPDNVIWNLSIRRSNRRTFQNCVDKRTTGVPGINTKPIFPFITVFDLIIELWIKLLRYSNKNRERQEGKMLNEPLFLVTINTISLLSVHTEID